MVTRLDAIRQRARGPRSQPVEPAAASYRNVLVSQDVALMEWTMAARADIPAMLRVVEAAMEMVDIDPIVPLSDGSMTWCLWCHEDRDRHEADCPWLMARAALAPLLEPEP